MGALMNTILLIDRESNSLRLLEHHLETSGYRVLRAKTGSVGIELAEEHLPDLLVMELILPDMDGFQVIDYFRGKALWRLIPIMVLSSRGSIRDGIEGLSKGADDYLPKPFNTLEFMLRAQSLLRRSG